jgi:hypothetical protein
MELYPLKLFCGTLLIEDIGIPVELCNNVDIFWKTEI